MNHADFDIQIQGVRPFALGEHSSEPSPAAWTDSRQISLTHDHPAQAQLEVNKLRLRERNKHLSLLAEIGAAINRRGTIPTLLDDSLRVLIDHLSFALAGICLCDEAQSPTLVRIQTRSKTDSLSSIDFIRNEAFYQAALPCNEPGLEVNFSSASSSEELANWASAHGLPIFARCALFCGNRRLGVLFLFTDQHLPVAIQNTLLAARDQLGSGISERQSMEALKFTQFTVDRLSTAILWFDAKGKVTQSNDAACDLTGYAHAELASAEARHFAPRLIGKAWDRIWARVCSRNSIIIETSIRKKNGDRIDVEVKCNLLQFDSGQYLCAMVTDISARKRAERQLQRSESHLQRTLSKMQLQIRCLPLAYVLLDAELRIVEWNPYAERLFGFRKSEMLGRHLDHLDLTCPRGQGELRSAMMDARENIHSYLETSSLSKDGKAISCEWTVTPVSDDFGKVEGVLCLAQDVTERTRLEEQCKRGQRLEAVGRLAAGIAHDFNNFLAIMLGFTDVIGEGLEAQNVLQGPVREVKAAGDRAKHLIHQLLTFSRNGAFSPQLVNLNEIVDALRLGFTQLIGPEMKLLVNVSQDAKPIFIDPGQLEQILLNLVGNARDAMAGQGELRVTTFGVVRQGTSRGRRSSRQDLEYWTGLSVSDSGCGMSAATKQRIFEPFFTTKEPGKGTGLGLAVVYGIVEQCGGILDVITELNQGTTITIYFPSIEQQDGQSFPRKDCESASTPAAVNRDIRS